MSKHKHAAPITSIEIPRIAPGTSILAATSHIGRTLREREKNARRISRRSSRDNGETLGRTLK